MNNMSLLYNDGSEESLALYNTKYKLYANVMNSCKGSAVYKLLRELPPHKLKRKIVIQMMKDLKGGIDLTAEEYKKVSSRLYRYKHDLNE